VRKSSGRSQYLALAGWLALTYLASAIGGLATLGAGSFYAELERPAWAPPPGLFAPVWTLLYALMGVAAWLVWRRRDFQGAQLALGLFLLHLPLNALWSWLFFAWRLGAWSVAEIVLLWLFILATLVTFWRVRALAGALLLPYLAWVSYAAALNYSLWRMNPQILSP
jgi:translocator protein